MNRILFFTEKSRKILQQTSFTTRYLKDKEPEALNALEGRVKNSLRRVREQTKNDPELFQHYLRRIQRREEVLVFDFFFILNFYC